MNEMKETLMNCEACQEFEKTLASARERQKNDEKNINLLGIILLATVLMAVLILLVVHFSA